MKKGKILIDKNNLEKLLLTETKKQIADKYDCSIWTIYRLIKLYNLEVVGSISKKCLFCNKKYKATLKHGTHLRQKYCSDRCREKHWIDLNPDNFKSSQKKWRLKTIVNCKFCELPIPNEIRKSGLVFCSEDCRKKQHSLKSKEYRKAISDAFIAFKESKGCCLCGYKKYGGSLDFHHVDSKDKILRISSTAWFFKSKKIIKELKKCILVCKNCHYELHRGNMNKSENGDV